MGNLSYHLMKLVPVLIIIGGVWVLYDSGFLTKGYVEQVENIVKHTVKPVDVEKVRSEIPEMGTVNLSKYSQSGGTRVLFSHGHWKERKLPEFVNYEGCKYLIPVLIENHVHKLRIYKGCNLYSSDIGRFYTPSGFAYIKEYEIFFHSTKKNGEMTEVQITKPEAFTYTGFPRNTTTLHITWSNKKKLITYHTCFGNCSHCSYIKYGDERDIKELWRTGVLLAILRSDPDWTPQAEDTLIEFFTRVWGDIKYEKVEVKFL